MKCHRTSLQFTPCDAQPKAEIVIGESETLTVKLSQLKSIPLLFNKTQRKPHWKILPPPRKTKKKTHTSPRQSSSQRNPPQKKVVIVIIPFKDAPTILWRQIGEECCYTWSQEMSFKCAPFTFIWPLKGNHTSNTRWVACWIFRLAMSTMDFWTINF